MTRFLRKPNGRSRAWNPFVNEFVNESVILKKVVRGNFPMKRVLERALYLLALTFMCAPATLAADSFVPMVREIQPGLYRSTHGNFLGYTHKEAIEQECPRLLTGPTPFYGLTFPPQNLALNFYDWNHVFGHCCGYKVIPAGPTTPQRWEADCSFEPWNPPNTHDYVGGPGWVVRKDQCAGAFNDGWRMYDPVDFMTPPGYAANPSEIPMERAYCYRDRCPAGTQGGFSAGCKVPFPISPKAIAKQCPADGNPVSIGTGNKFQYEKDISAVRPGGVDFERVYNSLLALTGRLGSMGNANSYWVHTYDRSLKISGSSATVRRHDGRSFQFFKSGASWVPEGGVQDSLEEQVSLFGALQGFRYRVFEDDSVELYDVSGKLLSITTRQGIVQTLVYDELGTLTEVRDSYGYRLTLQMDGVGVSARLNKVTHAQGANIRGVYSYGYDSEGRLASMTRQDGKSRLYHYLDATPYLAGITNELGVRYVSWTYDASGRALSSNSQESGQVSFVYNSDGSASVSQGGGTPKTYSFSTIHGIPRPSSVSRGECQSSCGGASGAQIEYDANGYVRSTTSAKGIKTTYVRDARGRELSRTEGEGATSRTITTEYHPAFNLVTKVVEPGKTVLSTYDSRGLLIERSYQSNSGGSAQTWKYSYNAQGLLESEDGPRTDVRDITTYAYDTAGNLISVTNALGQVTRYTFFTPQGLPARVIRPNGLVTDTSYDDKGRINYVNAGGLVTRFEYNPAGKITKKTLPDGTFQTLSYDSAGRLTQVDASSGTRLVYGYDSSGALSTATLKDQLGSQLSTYQRSVDTTANIIRVTGPGMSIETQLDAYDRPIQFKDGQGRITSIAYDPLARISQSKDPAGGITQFQYNLADYLTSVKDPRNVASSFSINGLGQTTANESQETGRTERRFDEAGQIVFEKTAAGQEITYQYDALGRVTKKVSSMTYDYPGYNWRDARVLNYTYDLTSNGVGYLGRVEQAFQLTYSYGGISYSSDYPESSLSLEYDLLGRVVSRKQDMAGNLANTSYTYNSQGQLTHMTYPSGAVVEYQYASGKVSAIRVNGRTVLQQISYHALGMPAVWGWGDGSIYMRGYDASGRSKSFPIGASNQTVTYDSAGRVARIDDSAGASKSQVFAYDLLDRLARSEKGDGSSRLTFQYDASGNRTQIAAPSGTTNYLYTASSNLLNAVQAPSGSSTVNSDANGNLNFRDNGERSYGYDLDNRLSFGSTFAFRSRTDGSWDFDMNFGSYSFNPLSERAYKMSFVSRYSSGSGSFDSTFGYRTFAYDENQRLIGEYPIYSYSSLSGYTAPLSQEVIYLMGVPVAVLRGTKLYYVHADHLGTPRALISASNRQVVWKWESDAFGNGQPTVDSLFAQDGPFNLRFPGQYYDEETVLHYNYYRDYDPSLGRYLQPDPIGLAGGLNRFSYVSADPTNSTDPNGLTRIRINYFAPSDRVGANLTQLPQTENTIQVFGHGYTDCNGISDERGSPNPMLTARYKRARSAAPTIDPATLARQIKAQAGYNPCMPITLWSCHQGCPGNEAFLDRLAAELPEHEICAPKGSLFTRGTWYSDSEGTGPTAVFWGVPYSYDPLGVYTSPALSSPNVRTLGVELGPGAEVSLEEGMRCVKPSKPPCDCKK